jgi:hypothetical protein
MAVPARLDNRSAQGNRSRPARDRAAAALLLVTLVLASFDFLRETWDRAARVVARYRAEYDLAEDVPGLGAEPDEPGQHRAWRRTSSELQRARRRLGRKSLVERDLGLERH